VCGQTLRREELRIVGKHLRIGMNGRRPLRGENTLGTVGTTKKKKKKKKRKNKEEEEEEETKKKKK
jgi:hypothetical protein